MISNPDSDSDKSNAPLVLYMTTVVTKLHAPLFVTDSQIRGWGGGGGEGIEVN